MVGAIVVATATALATFGDNLKAGMGKIGDKVKVPSTKTIDADGN